MEYKLLSADGQTYGSQAGRFICKHIRSSMKADSQDGQQHRHSCSETLVPFVADAIVNWVVRWCWVNFQCWGVLQFGLQ